MELLKVENLRKVFNAKLGKKSSMALKNISFSIDEGEFVAIMGPSGSGKTTLLNIIATLDYPTSGSVLLGGRNVCDISAKELSMFRRQNLGFVFQDFNLLDTFSLKDNILLPLVLARVPVEEMEQRLAPLAAQLGIADIIEQFPCEVSGGEKQRAAVARAVITEPKLVLADEPTGALDSRSSSRLLSMLTALNAQGKTILMVTHSAVAASCASRVLFIRDGDLFNQLCKGTDSDREFYERIAHSLAVLENRGESDE